MHKYDELNQQMVEHYAPQPGLQGCHSQPRSLVVGENLRQAHLRVITLEWRCKRADDMVLWDNWRAMHCTTGTKPGIRRLINRTTIAGDVLLGRVIGSE